MHLIHRSVAGIATAAVTAGVVLTAPGVPGVAAEPGPAEIALVWQEAALATVPFTPAQSLYLAFASTAVDKAVRHSLKASDSSEAAAVAQAAHDVLLEYFPGASGDLGSRLTTSLAAVPDGPAEDRGRAIGAEAADEVIASRVGDGRNDATIVYSADPGIGVWTPDARGFATPWYGFVDRIVGGRPVPVDGPDPVGSAEYRVDLAEVTADGEAGADEAKAATAVFFNRPAFALYRNALITHLRDHPIGLSETTDLFRDLDRSTAEAMRQTWRHKFVEGFWRPSVAITTDDGDPATPTDPGWTGVLALPPPYPDWPSGHGTLTAAFAETVRCHLGDVELTLSGTATAPPRTYGSLADLEDAAFMSRIWLGIHFRDAMDDAYLIGHTVAQRACS